MLDVTGILVSCLGIILLLARVLKLANSEPWFQVVKALEKPKAERNLPWQRRQ